MPLPEDVISQVRRCVWAGHYRVGWHAVQHMFEDGFERLHLLAALTGKLNVIEEYESENRVLLLGWFQIGKRTTCPLHIVCDLTPADSMDIVTAYIPGRPHWETPRRRGAHE